MQVAPPNILLVEDDTTLRALIASGLQREGYVITDVAAAQPALTALERQSFALAICDIMLPDQDGIALTGQIKQRQPFCAVLMLTALGDTEEKLKAFAAGADDYLVKPFDFRELLARMQALLKRYGSLAQPEAASLLQYHDLRVDLRTAEVTRAGQSIALTPREFQLLVFLLQHKEQVLSRDAIAAAVWQMHHDTGTNFVDVYIAYLRKKIDKPFANKLIHTKTGMGFVLRHL